MVESVIGKQHKAYINKNIIGSSILYPASLMDILGDKEIKHIQARTNNFVAYNNIVKKPKKTGYLMTLYMVQPILEVSI